MARPLPRRRAKNHHQELDHRYPVLDLWVCCLNPIQREGTLQRNCALNVQLCKDARYARKCVVFAKYAAYFAYICKICYICSVCTICTLAYIAYSLHILHIFYSSRGVTRCFQPPSRCIFAIFVIYMVNMHVFLDRCIYIRGRCISAIFSISSWRLIAA